MHNSHFVAVTWCVWIHGGSRRDLQESPCDHVGTPCVDPVASALPEFPSNVEAAAPRVCNALGERLGEHSAAATCLWNRIAEGE